MTEQVHNPSAPTEEVIGLAGTVAANAVAGEDIYAHLFDPNAPDPGYTVEDAAVRQPKPTLDQDGLPIAQRTSDRPGYWMPPTQAQIDKNPSLAQQEKYFPPGQRS